MFVILVQKQKRIARRSIRFKIHIFKLATSYRTDPSQSISSTVRQMLFHV